MEPIEEPTGMVEQHGSTEIQHSAALASDITGNELPTITRDEPGHITFVWRNDGLIVDAERFNDKGHVELLVWYDHEDFRQLLAQTRVDLLSPSSKGTLIRQLKDSNDALGYVHWDWILTCVTYKVTKAARQGEPAREIWPNEDSILVPEYLVDPFLYQGHPGVIFGDYGSLKSTVALLIAYIVQLPYRDNGLGLKTKDEATNTLYLDFEGDQLMFEKRWSAISKGFGIKAEMPILYRRMSSRLAESIDTILRIVVDNKIKFVIVDSLGPAVKGNLNDPEPAIEYNEALRRLGITSLTLAHNSKDPLTKQRSIFGSVFFSNLARSIWQCKIEGEREPGGNEAIVSLKHTKASFSDLYGTLGYKFKFTDTAISAETMNLEKTKLVGELPLTRQIISLLKEGSLTAKEIAEATDRPFNSVKVTLSRMKGRQVCSLPDQRWGLLETDIT